MLVAWKEDRVQVVREVLVVAGTLGLCNEVELVRVALDLCS